MRHRLHRHDLRLHVGREARIGRGRDGERLQGLDHRHLHAVRGRLDIDTRRFERVGDRQHVARLGADQFDRPAGNPRRAGVAARFDSVGHDVIVAAVQPLDPVDDEVRAADPLDGRAHGHEEIAQVDDFRLARRVEQLRPTGCENGGHDGIFGRTDRNDRKAVIAAFQSTLGGAGLHIAGGQFDLRAHRFQRLQMQVDRTVADRAAAGQRHGRFAHPRQHRTEHQNRRTHLAHHVVGRDRGGNLLALQRHAPLVAIALLRARHLGRYAQFVEQVPEAVDVGEPRQIAQRQLVVGEERARKKRQRAVLGARNRDLALEALTAGDANGVHRRALAQRARLTRGQAFSSVHWSGCWFSRAKSITWLTLVSATS